MNQTLSWRQQIEAWASDNKAGATETARGCARALISYADQAKSRSPREIQRAVLEICRMLLVGHSTMAPVVRLLNDVLISLSEVDNVRLGMDTLRRVSNESLALMEQAHSLVAEHAARLIPRTGTVVTISNSSAVARTLELASQKGANPRVVCLESRPGYEGRELAASLAQSGIDVTLVVDAAVLSELKGSDLAVMGADCIENDGVINKIGTAALAVGARILGVPACVIADTSKIWPYELKLPTLPSRDGNEVWAGFPPQIKVRNAYYELVPWEFLTSVVTERGLGDKDIVVEMGKHIRVDRDLATMLQSGRFV